MLLYYITDRKSFVDTETEQRKLLLQRIADAAKALMARLRRGCEPIHSTSEMFRGALRFAISVGLMLALWTVSRPAAAAMPAGVCDDRGASAIAPPLSPEMAKRLATATGPSLHIEQNDGPICSGAVDQANHAEMHRLDDLLRKDASLRTEATIRSRKYKAVQ